MSLRPLALALLLSWPSLLAAQSLGDVAKKEGERRQTVKPSGRVITNKDLPVVSAPPSDAAAAASDPVETREPAPTSSGSAAGDQAARGSAAEAGERANGDDTAAAPVNKDERYWGTRMKALRDEMARERLFAEALQSRINGLTTDFVNRDDPAQRDRIARDRQTAVDELARVQKSIVTRGQAIADLEEEARRAGVPAGWLRQ